MTDLVERLREVAGRINSGTGLIADCWSAMLDAADEIERLRAQVNGYRDDLEREISAHCVTINTLNRREALLREAVRLLRHVRWSEKGWWARRDAFLADQPTADKGTAVTEKCPHGHPIVEGYWCIKCVRASESGEQRHD